MTTHLIDIGNTKAVGIPKDLIEKYGLDDEVEIKAGADGIFIGKKRKVREGWEKQIVKAFASGENGDDEPLDNVVNEWDNSEWTWPE